LNVIHPLITTINQDLRFKNRIKTYVFSTKELDEKVKDIITSYTEQREKIDGHNVILYYNLKEINERYLKKVNETKNEKDINYLLDLYLNYTTLSYYFDEEHSVLATPLQRLKLTCRDFEDSGVSTYIESNKLAI
jgi:hypothetical protein